MHGKYYGRWGPVMAAEEKMKKGEKEKWRKLHQKRGKKYE